MGSEHSAKEPKGKESRQRAQETENIEAQQDYAVPFILTPANVLMLQRLVGNRVVQRILNEGSLRPSGSFLQRRFTVDAPDNADEREADSIARLVMNMPEQSDGSALADLTQQPMAISRVQREDLSDDEEELAQIMPLRLSNGITLERKKYELSNTVKIKGTQKTTKAFVNEVLNRAGYDPNQWFNDFVDDFTFLGRKLRDPIHKSLADHLKGVEQKFCEKYPKKKSPKEVGDHLGLNPASEEIRGARPFPKSASVSMHFYGLAIDLDYSKNPFINETKPPKKEEDRKDSTDQEKIDKIFPLAHALLGARGSKKFRPDRNLKFDTEDYNKKVREILQLDKMLEKYFSLLENDKLLRSYLNNSTHEFWKSTKTVEDARTVIAGHLKELSGVWSRKTETIREQGFTNFNEELIMGMNMHWGGTYGDMMHFDLRNTDEGEKIYNKGIRLLEELKKQNKK